MCTAQIQRDFYSFIALQGERQSCKFYDAIVSRDTLPPELQVVDGEIERLAVKTEQRWVRVYSPTTGVCDALSIRFQKRAIELARPLLERRRCICEQLNTVSDPFFGIFPAEVTSAIFEWAVAPRPTNDIISSAPDLRDTLRLASVMRSWRYIALATPSLWSSLRLCYSGEIDDPDLFEEYLETFEILIRRSGGVGIHLHVRMGRGCEDYSEPLVAIIRRESPRIRTLRICVSPYTPGPSDYLALIDFPFPRADVVAVHAPSNYEDHSIPALLLPHVSQLCFNIPGLRGFRGSCFSTVTDLELDQLSLYDLRFLLQSASTLQALKANCCNRDLSHMLEVDEDGESIVIQSNGIITRVQPLTHDTLQKLDFDSAEALCILTLPGLQTLLLWGQHVGVDRFIARSACRLAHFGVDTLSALESLATLDTVRHVCMDSLHSSSFHSLFDTLNDCDEPTANLAKSALARIESITVRVSHCSTCTPLNRESCYLAMQPFVVFHRKYGRALKRFEIRAECYITVTADMCDTSPPIHVNGLFLAQYCRQILSPCLDGDVGCDLLDRLDRFILWGLKAKSSGISALVLLCRKLGLGKQMDAVTWERRGWGTDAGTWEMGGWGTEAVTWEEDGWRAE